MNQTELEMYAHHFVQHQEWGGYEQINELNRLMNNEKINSQTDAINHTRHGRYIVGSFSASGALSFAENPTVQYSQMDARRECARLARLNHGKLFIFVKLSGAELVPAQQAVSV